MKQLVLIPIYNEEKYILEVFHELRRWYHGDVVVVDDGSTDHSPTIIDQKLCGPVQVIRHSINEGYGKSLIDGFQYAIENSYGSIVTMDADWQHQPCYVRTFFETLGKGDVDVLSGSRYLSAHERDTSAPAERAAVNKEITSVINELTGYHLTDAFCGFKGYLVSALKKLALNETGYSFPLQFWIQAAHFKLRVREVAVPRIYVDATRSFGAHLDDTAVRLKHYHDTITKEVARWNNV